MPASLDAMRVKHTPSQRPCHFASAVRSFARIRLCSQSGLQGRQTRVAKHRVERPPGRTLPHLTQSIIGSLICPALHGRQRRWNEINFILSTGRPLVHTRVNLQESGLPNHRSRGFISATTVPRPRRLQGKPVTSSLNRTCTCKGDRHAVDQVVQHPEA